MAGKTALIAAALGVMLGSPAALAAEYFTLTSTSIRNGERISRLYGGDDQKRACSPKNPAICPCPGKNVSPQLKWSNAPAGTKSFAIVMYDIDGQWGAGVTHWVAYNIPATTSELPEGDGTRGIGFTGGAGTRNNPNYMGPCPPQGDGPHNYLITVMATALEPTLAAGLTRDQFLAAAKGKLLASATIAGLYAREY